jgi:transposase-like protein
MPKPYSTDLRERAVEAVESGASRREAAEIFKVGVSSVVRWCRSWSETGSAAPKRSGGSVSPLERGTPASRASVRAVALPWRFSAESTASPRAKDRIGLGCIVTCPRGGRSLRFARPARCWLCPLYGQRCWIICVVRWRAAAQLLCLVCRYGSRQRITPSFASSESTT